MLQKLQRTISAERIGRYILAAKGDLDCAIRIYAINIQVSQTLYGVLHGYEIALRNAMHDNLKAHYGCEDWYAQASLSRAHFDMVQDAQASAARSITDGSKVPVGKVIAELRLGFWTGLVAPAYEQSLWPCLRRAFPNTTPSRQKTYWLLRDIWRIRNRIAHHERILGSNGRLYVGLHPIHRREMTLPPEAILECVEWICPATSEWIRTTAQFENCTRLLESIKGARFDS